MKRLAYAFALFLLSVSPLFAIQTDLIDDVIRMSRSGVAAETIIDYVQASRAELTVTADDIIAMKNAGVSETVINAVIAKGGAAAAPTASNGPVAQQPPARPTAAETPDTAAADGGFCLTFDPPVSLFYPYWYPSIPVELWDPYWYMPRLDTRSGPPVARSAHGSPTVMRGSGVAGVAAAIAGAAAGRAPAPAPASAGRAPASTGVRAPESGGARSPESSSGRAPRSAPSHRIDRGGASGSIRSSSR